MSSGTERTRLIVTGGGSGIGRAIAVEMLRGDRADVVVLDRDGDAANATLNALGDRGRAAIEIDVGDPVLVTEAVEAAVGALGGLDAIVNCAGINIHEDTVSATPAAFEQTLRVNVMGTFFCSQTAARQMIKQETGGTILMMSSTAAFGYVSGLGPHYTASKAAIAGMATAMAGELAPQAIRVNAIAPGPTVTPMTDRLRRSLTREELARYVPLGRFIEPAEVAQLVAYLVSPAGAMISGQVIGINGATTAFAAPRRVRTSSDA